MSVTRASVRYGRALCRGLVLLALITSSHARVATSIRNCDPRSCQQPGESFIFSGFVQNQGQWNTDARFVAECAETVVCAERGAFVIQRRAEKDGQFRLGVVRLVLEGGESVQPVGQGRAPGEFNFFRGEDPHRWVRRAPAYKAIVYSSVRPGLDLKLYERDGRIEYDVGLLREADAEDFVVRCEGVDSLSVEPNGDLCMATPIGPLVQHAPSAAQLTARGWFPVSCTFRLVDRQRFGLEVPDRLPGAAVVIDPGLTWATYLGGANQDRAIAVGVSPEGNPIVLGRTNSRDFPTTAGVFDASVDSVDATVTCFDPFGSSLIFSTVIGGSSWEAAQALAIRSDGQIAIAGRTASTDYPTLPSSYATTFSGGINDACVTVLTADGSDIVLSTFLGGGCGEDILGIAFNSAGSVVVAGETCSPNFPTTPSAVATAYQGGPLDAFVATFDPALAGSSQLVCSTLLGTAGEDRILDLELAADDDPIVVGQTTATNFPTTPGAFDETPGQAGLSGFVSRLATDASAFVASTHFKTAIPMRLAIEGPRIWVAGRSGSGFPVTPAAYDSSSNGADDCVLARFDTGLTNLGAATYLGGQFNDDPLAIAIDMDGNVIIAGITQSSNYPTTAGAFDTVFGGTLGDSTTMVSRLSSDLTQLLYSSFLGPTGPMSSHANGLAVMAPADVVIVGEGAVTGFPVTPGAFDTTFNGGDLGGADGYVARMLLTLTWSSLGGAVAGSNGTPLLSGEGDLIGGTPVILLLQHAKPTAPAFLIIGSSMLDAPFKGGHLVPTPSVISPAMTVNGQGTLTLTSTWPVGLPTGLTFYSQMWIVDAAGPAGFAASNGLSGTTP
jgi:hypothetical protein